VIYLNSIDYQVKNRLAGNVEISIGYYFLEHLGVELNPQYSGKGYEYRKTEYIEGMSVTRIEKNEYSVLELPILLKPTLKLDNTLISFFGGPSLSRIVGAKSKSSVELRFMGEDTTIELGDEDFYHDGLAFPLDTAGTLEYVPYEDLYRSSDFSIVFGLGFQRLFGSEIKGWSLYADVKCVLGLLDITEISWEGEKKLESIYRRLFLYFDENNIDPEEYGFSNNDENLKEPIHKFFTFTTNAGLRYLF